MCIIFGAPGKRLADLVGAPCPWCVRNALVVVCGERAVLRLYRDFAALALRLLAIENSSEYETALQAARASELPMVVDLLKATVLGIRPSV